MSLQKIDIRNSVLVLMIIAAVATRSLNLGHIATWANFTPVGAVSLFAGAYFTDKWKAYLVPILTLLASDLIINYFTYHHAGLYSGAWAVYLSFILIVSLGSLITYVKTDNTFLNAIINIALVGGSAIIAVGIHWLITDIEPWLNSAVYAKGPSGYIESLIAALPFEKNLLFGNLVYCTILFGGFELAKTKYTALRADEQLAL